MRAEKEVLKPVDQDKQSLSDETACRNKLSLKSHI